MIGPGNTLEAFFKLNDQISTPLKRVRESAAATERKLKDLTGEVADLERKLRILSKSKATPEVRLNMRHFQYQKEKLEAELKAMTRDRTIRIDVKAKTAAAKADLAKLYAEGKLMQSLFGKASPTPGFAAIGTSGLVALIPVISAAIPLALQLGTALGGLLPILGAMGAGFGLALAAGIPFFKQTVEGWKAISKAEEKVKNAKTLEERKQALEELKAAQQSLSPVQRDLIKQTRQLGQEWKAASKPLTDAIGQMALAGVSTTRKVLGGLKGDISPFAKLMSRRGNAVANFFASPKEISILHRLLRGFMPILESVGNSFGNIFKLVQSITLAAIPLGRWIAKAFENLTGNAANRAENNIAGMRRAFVATIPTIKMTAGLISDLWHALLRIGGSVDLSSVVGALRIAVGYLERFVLAANEVLGPRLQESVRNLGELLVTFIAPFQNVSGFIIDALNTIAEIFIALPGPIKNATGQLIGFALVFKSLGLVSMISAGFKTLAAVILYLIPATRGLAASFIALNATNPVGWIGLATTAAVGLTFAMWKLFSQTNTVQTAEQKFQESLRKTISYADRAAAAVDKLRDARFALEHGEINFQRSQIALQQAIERRKGTKAGTRERREADLDVREAQLNFQEAKNERNKARRGANRAAGKGAFGAAGVYAVNVNMQRELAHLRDLQEQRSSTRFPALVPVYDKQIAASKQRLEALTKAWEKNARASGMTRREIEAMEKSLAKGGPDAQKIIKHFKDLAKTSPDLRNYSKTLSSVLDDSKLSVEAKVQAINLILGGSVPPPDTKNWTDAILAAITVVSVAASGLQTTLSTIVTNFSNAQTKPPATPKKPKRNATGGIITSKIFSSLGEQGPEAVVPLGPGYRQQRDSVLRQIGARPGGMGGGGGALVAINGPITISNGDDMESFMARLEEAATRALANSPYAMSGEMTA